MLVLKRGGGGAGGNGADGFTLFGLGLRLTRRCCCVADRCRPNADDGWWDDDDDDDAPALWFERRCDDEYGCERLLECRLR